jgi:hypothetical protein
LNGHLQKRLGCVQLNAFTGAHPLRSLTSAVCPACGAATYSVIGTLLGGDAIEQH